MPIIQFEQDGPEVIARTRRRLALLAADLEARKSDPVTFHGAVAGMCGYLGALLMEQLITSDTYEQLLEEVNAMQFAVETEFE